MEDVRKREKVNKGVPPHKTSLYVACGKNVIKMKLKQGAFSHATVLFQKFWRTKTKKAQEKEGGG